MALKLEWEFLGLGLALALDNVGDTASIADWLANSSSRFLFFFFNFVFCFIVLFRRFSLDFFG